MNILDFEQEELVYGTNGYDTELSQSVTFIKWTDEECGMVLVKSEQGDLYETYEEEIEWSY